MPKKIAHVAFYAVTATVPALAMLAAHWFPWRGLLGRDLSRIECYAWGTAWIIGVASAVMRMSRHIDAPLAPDEAATIAELSAASAGIATIAAYLIDDWGAHRRNRAAARIAAEAKRNAENR